MASRATALGVLLFAWSVPVSAQPAGPPQGEVESAPPAAEAPAEPAPIAEPSDPPGADADAAQPEAPAPTAAPKPHVPEAAPHYHSRPPPPRKRWQWDDPDADAAAGLHSGFYTHIELKGALFSVGELTEGIEGGTGVGVALGYSIPWVERLVGFIKVDLVGDQSARAFGVGTLAIGLAYYLDPSNLMFTAQLGGTTVHFIDEEGDDQDRGGTSFAVSGGREWPIDGGPLAVGGVVQLRLAAIEGDGSYLGATAGLSVTYN